MGTRLSVDLPQFKMFDEFFSELGEEFTPIKLSSNEKQEYVNALKTLGGSPAHHFRQLRDDLEITAIVRDVRRYAADRLFVRFDFRRMTNSGRFGLPIQLMALFDDLKNIVSYTVLRDRGDMEDGVLFRMTKTQYNWDVYETTEDVSEVLEFLSKEPLAEVAVEDKANNHHLMYAYAGKGTAGNAYDIEWYVACEPWLLIAKAVDMDCVGRVLSALKDGGIKAVETSTEWVQFDFEKLYHEHGVDFDIDLELHRFLERAKKNGDVMAEESIRAVGINEDQDGEPYKVNVAYGSGSRMMDRISSTIDSSEEKPNDAEQMKCLCYLALRNRMESMHNFGWCFHFGKGVPTDYHKAIYWQEKSAAMGDACSMQNLGVIYSESHSPVHDCAKAFEWYEKAIAKGDTYAMEQLAHCLLCGENGKDADRALELSRRAYEAHPEMDDFRETYERAQRVVCGEEE